MSINNKRLLEKKLQQQLQEFYHYEEKPEAIILSKNLDKVIINVFLNHFPINKTKAIKITIQNIISNRMKRIFNLLYYNNDSTNYNFSYDYYIDYNNENKSHLTLTIKNNVESIEKISEKLFDTMMIVLPNNLTLYDEDVKLYEDKRSILNAVSEFGLIDIAHDNDIDAGDYYDSKLADYVIENYNDDINNVFITEYKTLTKKDFKKFCLLLDKEYNNIISGDKNSFPL